MTSDVRDVAVVGGGPAGMAAAWHLRDRDTVLLEASDRLGGRLKSEPRGDYWLNFGCHLFPGPGSHLHDMMSELKLELLPIPGEDCDRIRGSGVLVPAGGVVRGAPPSDRA